MYIPQITNITPFDPLVFKSHFYNWDWKIIEPICVDLIGDNPKKIHLEQGDAASSITNPSMPHKMPEFEAFYKWLKPITNDIIFNKWNLSKGYEYRITNSWVNVHGKGGETMIHDHGPTTLVVTAYLQLPENGGFIQLKDPLEYHHGHLTKQFDAELWSWKTIPAKSGDVVMFPGWMRHKTQPNNSDDKRWVLTTNIDCINTPN